MVKRQQQLIFLANKELNTVYRSGRSAAFVTLTYDDNHLPVNENGFYTLRRKDVQDFLKNLRRQQDYYHEKIPFKVMYTGEYGDGSHSTTKTGISTHRPHYHLVFLGLSSAQVRKYTRKLWKHGLCDIGELSQGGLRYITKYMQKALPEPAIRDLRKDLDVENPFFYHSIGLGKEWIDENMDKIVEDGFTFNINGKKCLYPANIMRYVAWHMNCNYIEYVKDFMRKEKFYKYVKQGINYSQHDFEKSYIEYKMKVNNLRMKNKPVDDITLSKHWVRPYHYPDRQAAKVMNQLSDEARKSFNKKS